MQGLVNYSKEAGFNFMCDRKTQEAFEQQSKMIHCEKIPLVAAGEKAVGTRMKTGGQLGGYCGCPGKRLATWSTERSEGTICRFC